VGIEAVFMGAALGYKLDEAAGAVRGDAAERVLEGWGGSSPACRCTSALRWAT
jgi:hypothetical protein